MSEICPKCRYTWKKYSHIREGYLQDVKSSRKYCRLTKISNVALFLYPDTWPKPLGTFQRVDRDVAQAALTLPIRGQYQSCAGVTGWERDLRAHAQLEPRENLFCIHANTCLKQDEPGRTESCLACTQLIREIQTNLHIRPVSPRVVFFRVTGRNGVKRHKIREGVTWV